MEKNVKNFKLDILIFIIFLVPITTIALNAQIIVGDEIWNFQNVMKLSRGLEIYKDCNVIVTPIFFSIGNIFLRVLGENILSFRIYNIIIFSLLMFSVYKLFSILKIDKLKSFVYTCFIFILITPYISVGANYNVLAIFFYIVGIIVFLSRKDKKHSEILQGILVYLILFTKQNIGILYVFSIILIYFMNYKSKAITKLLKIGIISIVLCVLNLLFMYIKGSLYDFINYCFLGMKSFTENNFAIDKDTQILVITEIVVGVVSYILAIIFMKKNTLKDLNYIIKSLLLFSLFLNLSIFPIVNLYHTSFGIILNIVILIYITDKIMENNGINIETVMLKTAIVIVYIFINIFGVICGIRSIENIKFNDKDSVYYSSNMSVELYEEMNEIISYIEKQNNQGTDVIVLSQNAALYMVPLKQSHAEFDLAFSGNLGYNGEEELMSKIKSLKNTEILLNSNMYWQEISNVRLYIISNFQKIGEIGEYYIFESRD